MVAEAKKRGDLERLTNFAAYRQPRAGSVTTEQASNSNSRRGSDGPFFLDPPRVHQVFCPKSSASLAMFAAIRRVSSLPRNCRKRKARAI
jgi:hypothetical protein